MAQIPILGAILYPSLFLSPLICKQSPRLVILPLKYLLILFAFYSNKELNYSAATSLERRPQDPDEDAARQKLAIISLITVLDV